MREVHVLDSHTEGEPTRLVTGKSIALQGNSIQARVESFNAQFEKEFLPLLLEPRSFEAVVGAWLGNPTNPDCKHDLIFFNPVGALGMCGHGTIGVMATLANLGLEPGLYRLNTPVGVVEANLLDKHTVQVQNVPSYRIAKDVVIEVEGFGQVMGDVAWGGNTFFLIKDSGLDLSTSHLEVLGLFTKAVLKAANEQWYPSVNHVEVFGAPSLPGANSKNYVLCPGGEYDRSPCGTGTSAKLACLAADGKLEEGQVWIQESIIGTSYRAWYRRNGDQIIPTIEGRAFVTGRNTLIFEDEDPMAGGIRK
jgi:4-hydroxyproline epimerase